MPRPSARLQQSVRLVPFEASVPQDLQVHATVVWSGSGQLNLSYGLLSRTGLGDLVLPRGLIDGLQPDGVRRDGLWDTTCFEAFLGLPGDTRYWEINLAANGDWALYGFSDYRDGRSDPSQTVPPQVQLRRWHHQLRLEASLDLSAWWPPNVSPDIALTAVLDRGDNGLIHWAISHPSDRADFHQRQTFLSN